MASFGQTNSPPLFGEEVWMKLMGRKRSRDEYEAEDEQVEEISVEEILEAGLFDDDEEEEEEEEEEKKKTEEVEEVAIEAKEPWVVRGETWLQAVKLEKQRRWRLPPSRPLSPAPGLEPAPTPALPLVFPALQNASLFADQEDSEPWNGDFFGPAFSWSTEDFLSAAAGSTTSDGLQNQLGEYIQGLELDIYNPYSTYGPDPFFTFSNTAAAEGLFAPAFSYDLTYSPAPLVPEMDSSAYSFEGALDVVAPTAKLSPSELGYFDVDLFDHALRSAAREAEVAASSVAMEEEVPALVPGPTPLHPSHDGAPSPTARDSSAPIVAPLSQGSLKRKRFWGKFEEDEAWFVAAQRKLVRSVQQHREFKVMREAKVRQMAEIVGGEIAASLAEARAKVEEHARLVAEQRSLVEKERRLVEELRGMVEERRRTAEVRKALPSAASSTEENKRALVDDSETAVEEKRVENSRRLLAGLRNTENWGSSLFFVGEKEVGGPSTKESPEVNSVTEEAKAVAEINGELWRPQVKEEEGGGEGKELELLVEQLSTGQEEQESQSPAQREETRLEQSDHALAQQMQRLEYEGDEDASMLGAILTHGDPTTVTSLPPTKALRPPPAVPEATSATPQPLPTSPPHPAKTSPPEVSAPSQRGRRPTAAQKPDDAIAVHERRFLRSSGTTWVEEVSRLAAVTAGRQVQEEQGQMEQRRRQLSSWNAEVSRGIALSQQRQSALLVDLQMERDRHWVEVGRRIGAGRLAPVLAENTREDQEDQEDPEPERVVSSRRRQAPTFKPAWDWMKYCRDWQDDE
ncbi:hypothetical protein L211DRAFT_881594 [Terfezia boudieri ATCC MYA-4762]|uniref:Uncharacterized protein n=1 Tax=Terfezia boudieri ATCC MYA-4762 TaxID=1051890 RepID=A0A3N4M1H0_9PEZI|nr:hypothetical protein L211DRAFT_881594 [Terfezia boudieri ATCC MYA-4762]